MAKKAKQPQKQRRTVAERQAAVKDATFGMKNKNRSRRVQTQIRTMQDSVMTADERREQLRKKQELEERRAKQQMKKQQEREAAQKRALAIRMLRQPTLKPGQKASEVRCVFYKTLGYCPNEGCEYNHDPNFDERASERRDIYVDKRDGTDFEAKTTTVCKYFLLAIEEKKMGHFWSCPNGKTCIYRHAVPADYIPPEKRPKDTKKTGMLEDDETAMILAEARREQLETKTPMSEDIFRELMGKKVEEEQLRAEANAKEHQRLLAAMQGKSGKSAEAEMAARQRRVTGKEFWITNIDRLRAEAAERGEDVEAEEAVDATSDLMARLKAKRQADAVYEAEQYAAYQKRQAERAEEPTGESGIADAAAALADLEI